MCRRGGGVKNERRETREKGTVLEKCGKRGREEIVCNGREKEGSS